MVLVVFLIVAVVSIRATLWQPDPVLRRQMEEWYPDTSWRNMLVNDETATFAGSDKHAADNLKVEASSWRLVEPQSDGTWRWAFKVTLSCLPYSGDQELPEGAKLVAPISHLRYELLDWDGKLLGAIEVADLGVDVGGSKVFTGSGLVSKSNVERALAGRLRIQAGQVGSR